MRDTLNFSGTYLVTGAGGFLGSHLCERLIALGAQVVGADNFITGRRENMKDLLKDRNFSFIEWDVSQPPADLGVPTFSGIFHLASPASPEDYYKYPIETLHVGAFGSENVLTLARKYECPILLTSTSEVYGDPAINPQKESYWGNVNPIGIRSCYDEAKRFLEALAMAHHRQFGTAIRLVRIFNTYGPRMRLNDGRVVPNFFMQALQGEDLTVYGDGSQTRSFCYVSDLVEGLVQAFCYEDVNPTNLGNPTELSILDFAKKIIALSGSNSKIQYKDLPKDDPKLRRPDISRAKECLGWEPVVDLDTGLSKTMEYFKGCLS